MIRAGDRVYVCATGPTYAEVGKTGIVLEVDESDGTARLQLDAPEPDWEPLNGNLWVSAASLDIIPVNVDLADRAALEGWLDA